MAHNTKDLIDVASKEVGYREGAGNRTKYGVYTGANVLHAGTKKICLVSIIKKRS